MGSGSSTEPAMMGSEIKIGGQMFEQRPPHIRSLSKQHHEGNEQEEFTDISYSELGGIVSPQVSKIVYRVF